MNMGKVIERVRGLSDEQLLAGLSGVLDGNRRLLARVLAHLAEVEERRLHLLAGHGSLFVYCTCRLKMSEDEAYRRIRVARLALHFPCVLELIAGGQVSLSVMALVAVSASARSGSIEAAPSSVVAEPALCSGGPAALPAGGERVFPEAHLFGEMSMSEAPPGAGAEGVEQSADREGIVRGVVGATRPRQPSSIVEPLSPGRYRVQFTADAELKQRIELARDLLRHAVPQGDLATIIGRALELLIESTLRRRFGKGSDEGDGPAHEAASARAGDSVLGDVGSHDGALRFAAERDETIERETSVEAGAIPSSEAEAEASASVCEPCAEDGGRDQAGSDSEAPALGEASRRFPAEARRTVLERDGLGCSWVAPDGTCCNSRAWLEHDHITPHGLGGSNDAANGRLLCQPHNRLAAEQAYGQNTMARIIDRRRATPSVSAARSSSDPT